VVAPAQHSPVDLGGDRYKLSSRRTFDRWGAGYDHNIFVRLFAWQWDRAVLSELLPLPDGARVLDLGCATGRLLAKLAGSQNAVLAGADISRSGLESAAHKLDSLGCSAELRLCDIEQQLPWDDGSFDFVVMSGVLHHLPDPDSAFRQALRVLRPGGRFVVTDPYFFTPARQLVNAVLRVAPVHGDCQFYQPGAVARRLKHAGFTDGGWQRISWHSFIATGTRPGASQMG
jgi:ubiquinone/menaquinone biosynthesis C-methylase UbiE